MGDLLQNIKYLEDILFTEVQTFGEDQTIAPSDKEDVLSGTTQTMLSETLRRVSHRVQKNEDDTRALRAKLVAFAADTSINGDIATVTVTSTSTDGGSGSVYSRLEQPLQIAHDVTYNSEVDRVVNAFKDRHQLSSRITQYVLLERPVGLKVFIQDAHVVNARDVSKQQDVPSYWNVRVVPPVAFRCNGFATSLPHNDKYFLLYREVSSTTASVSTIEEMKAEKATVREISQPLARSNLRL